MYKRYSNNQSDIVYPLFMAILYSDAVFVAIVYSSLKLNLQLCLNKLKIIDLFVEDFSNHFLKISDKAC